MPVRSVEAWDGLAAVGRGGIGRLSIALPGLLLPDRSRTTPREEVLGLGSRPTTSGRRRYVISRGPELLEFELPIPTPDLTATGAGEPVSDGPVTAVRGPVSRAALERLAPNPPELIVLSNARALLAEGAPFVEAVGAIRAALGPRPILWAPRVATAPRVPFLLYAGVDLFDTVEARMRAAAGTLADPELGELEGPVSAAPYRAASPPDDGPLAERAESDLANELRRSVAAARMHRLRDLVEARQPAEPLLAELLRHADRLLYPALEATAPVATRGIRPYVLRESFRRPEVRRFRERLQGRYRPPLSKRVLLVVPCSKTKPYRNSRSHRRFASAWESLEGTDRIHVVSVTSPLGVVPRELEDVPPARHYDIPVTGDWDEAEREAVAAGLAHLEATGEYAEVVLHLDPAEYGFLREIGPSSRPHRWTVSDDRTTSAPAIESLRTALAQALAELPPSRGTLRTVREELRALAAFQFGAEAADRLFQEPLRLHGRPWFQRLSDGHGLDLATWREERGLFQLTVGGGERIGPDSGVTVEVAEGVPLEGDLFDPGVRRADAGIRVGDAVVLYRAGSLLGVGEAEMPGPAMGRLGRGLAVRVRHRTPRAVAEGSIQPVPVGPAGRSSSG